MSELLNTRTYRPCADKCGRCKPCKEFAKVLQEINLGKRSPIERQREADIRKVER